MTAESQLKKVKTNEDDNDNDEDEDDNNAEAEAELLAELMEMGFNDVRARKGLVHGTSLDGALAWLSEHQDDADIDQPYMVSERVMLRER